MPNFVTQLIYIITLLSLGWQPLLAHEMRPASLNIVQVSDDGEYRVSWKVPARGDRRLALQVLLDEAPAFVVEDARFIGGSHIQTGRFERPQGLMGAEITIVGLDTTFTDAMLRVESLDGGIVTQRLSPENPSYVFDDQASGFGLMWTYGQYGVQHILIGIDHLLFVACLVFIAGFTRRLFWAITGFTLAHSITLALAALDIVRLPIAAVEAVIALSIVFLATEIVKQRHDSLTYRYPVVVSSAFGLLHGFGFAAVLAQIGLPRQEELTALLCFNLGVEIGQLLFIAALSAVLWLFRQLTLPALSGWRIAGSYAIGSIALMWVIERVQPIL